MSVDVETLFRLVPDDDLPPTTVYLTSRSPDRADALVHAVTHLILNRNPLTFW